MRATEVLPDFWLISDLDPPRTTWNDQRPPIGPSNSPSCYTPHRRLAGFTTNACMWCVPSFELGQYLSNVYCLLLKANETVNSSSALESHTLPLGLRLGLQALDVKVNGRFVPLRVRLVIPLRKVSRTTRHTLRTRHSTRVHPFSLAITPSSPNRRLPSPLARCSGLTYRSSSWDRSIEDSTGGEAGVCTHVETGRSEPGGVSEEVLSVSERSDLTTLSLPEHDFRFMHKSIKSGRATTQE